MGRSSRSSKELFYGEDISATLGNVPLRAPFVSREGEDEESMQLVRGILRAFYDGDGEPFPTYARTFGVPLYSQALDSSMADVCFQVTIHIDEEEDTEDPFLELHLVPLFDDYDDADDPLYQGSSLHELCQEADSTYKLICAAGANRAEPFLSRDQLHAEIEKVFEKVQSS